jgi:hypothetical protein
VSTDRADSASDPGVSKVKDDLVDPAGALNTSNEAAFD